MPRERARPSLPLPTGTAATGAICSVVLTRLVATLSTRNSTPFRLRIALTGAFEVRICFEMLESMLTAWSGLSAEP